MTHYLFTSWLQPFIAWSLGLTTPFKYFGLSLFFSVAFLVLFAYHGHNHLNREDARKSFLLFISLPVGMTSLYWVGYDGLTLFLMLIGLILLKSNRRFSWLASCFIGVLLGLQHFEQALLGFLLALSYVLLVPEKKADNIRRILIFKLLVLIVGILLGKSLLAAIIAFNQIP
jgi:predicted branched-subunit amino acid permease